MAVRPGWLRQFHRNHRTEAPTLVVFPHAGSGASAYREFARDLSRHFAVSVCQYPGRQDRVGEPAATTLPELARGAWREYQDGATGGELTVFGHSMGAFVAFEFVRLAEAAGVPVRLLCPSASVAPSAADQLPPHPTDDKALLAHLAVLDGTGDQVMANEQLMRLALPVVRADYRAFDSYTCDDDVRVQAKVHVIGGSDDPFVSPGDLFGWQRHAESELAVTLFDGGHFHIHYHGADIAELLAPVGARP